MDPVWSEFRNAPSVYLYSHKMDVNTFVDEMLQVRIIDTSRPEYWPEQVTIAYSYDFVKWERAKVGVTQIIWLLYKM